ncbi:hypothetical protein WEI85_00570 [Actinomycetes bacterium KLBMP 9797]
MADYGAVFGDPPWRDYVAGVLSVAVELIQDPDDTWHKGGAPVASLRDLVDDLVAVASRLADTDQTPPDPRLVAQFLSWAKPRRLAGKVPEDTVGYRRPAWRATERDDMLLALAAVLAFALWVDPDRRTCVAWAVYHDANDALWPTPTEGRELRQMADALRTALAARFTRRRKPFTRPADSRPAESAT